MKANKPEKRKDIMTNIKRRLELGTYSVSDVIRNQTKWSVILKKYDVFHQSNLSCNQPHLLFL